MSIVAYSSLLCRSRYLFFGVHSAVGILRSHGLQNAWEMRNVTHVDHQFSRNVTITARAPLFIEKSNNLSKLLSAATAEGDTSFNTSFVF